MKNELEFKDVLRDIMVDKNLNQTQIAELIGVKQSQVSEWLSGKSNPGYDSLRMICKALDVSGDDILSLN